MKGVRWLNALLAGACLVILVASIVLGVWILAVGMAAGLVGQIVLLVDQRRKWSRTRT